jgi:DNA-binding CsgD family transcriptional regulator
MMPVSSSFFAIKLPKLMHWMGVSLLLLFVCSCKQIDFNYPLAHKGKIDLSKWNFTANGSVPLDGEWLWLNGKDCSRMAVIPNSIGLNEKGGRFQEYELQILVPHKHHEPLVLKIDGVATAYQLFVNHQRVLEVGKVGLHKASAQPEFHKSIVPLVINDSVIDLKLIIANHHHYKGGILKSVYLGTAETIQMEDRNASLTGGLLLGVCLLSIIVYSIMYLLLPSERYFIFYAAFMGIVFLHLLCLTNRLMYAWVSWEMAYKIELATIFLGVICKFLFYNSFFSDLIKHKLMVITLLFLGVQVLLVLALPAPFFTYFDLAIPYNFVIFLLISLAVFIKAIMQNREGAVIILVFNIFLFVMLVHEKFIIDKHFQEVGTVHIATMIYITGISLLLIKRIIHTFQREKELSVAIWTANEKLEKQKHHLEEIVQRRTTQLLEAEQQSHQLQLEKKERDLHMLASDNFVKYQFTKNLIAELDSLPKSEKELKSSLNLLITKLKSQAVIDEKLSTLQKDMDKINAAFYERLAEKFPELSKTERELCAYIKLNLSNKDIAELRKTSLNTINVTRSRLRKKLGLSRDEELEGFMLLF